MIFPGNSEGYFKPFANKAFSFFVSYKDFFLVSPLKNKQTYNTAKNRVAPKNNHPRKGFVFQKE